MLTTTYSTYICPVLCFAFCVLVLLPMLPHFPLASVQEVDTVPLYVCGWLGLDRSMCAVLSHFSHVPLSGTPWTVGRQAPLSMGFSRQGFSRVSSQPRDPTCNPHLLHLLAPAGGFFTTSATWEAPPFY